MLATDWANLTIAGAFLGGLAVGVVASLRIIKLLGNYLIALYRDEHSSRVTEDQQPPPDEP